MSEQTKLLPCPFDCGEKHSVEWIGDPWGSHWYRCSECKCSTREYTSEESARSAWNRRAQPVVYLPMVESPPEGHKWRLVPDTHVVVPREPSNAMCHRGGTALGLFDAGSMTVEYGAMCIYFAMLLAAQKEPGHD